MSANAQQQKVPLGILTAMVVGGMVGARHRPEQCGSPACVKRSKQNNEEQ